MLSAEAKRIVEEAKKRGLWLYDPTYRKWYSPEDFEHIFHYANATDEFLNQLKLKHPNDGINAGFQQLATLQNKLQNFVQIVTEYYKKYHRL